jgi:hypothetical protein
LYDASTQKMTVYKIPDGSYKTGTHAGPFARHVPSSTTAPGGHANVLSHQAVVGAEATMQDAVTTASVVNAVYREVAEAVAKQMPDLVGRISLLVISPPFFEPRWWH